MSLLPFIAPVVRAVGMVSHNDSRPMDTNTG